jgi:hypothetical protein
LNIEIDKNSLTEDNFIDEIYKAILKKYDPKKKSDYDPIISDLEKFSDRFMTITGNKYEKNGKKSDLIFKKSSEILGKIQELENAKAAKNAVINNTAAATAAVTINKSRNINNAAAARNAGVTESKSSATAATSTNGESVNYNHTTNTAGVTAATPVTKSEQVNSKNSSKIMPLSQIDEELYSDIITKLTTLQRNMDKEIKLKFKEKRERFSQELKIYKKPAQKKQGRQKNKIEPIKPLLQNIGEEDFTKLIRLFLIIQKLRGKLENKGNNSTKLDTLLKRLIKDYIYRLPPKDKNFAINKSKSAEIKKNLNQQNRLKNEESTKILEELKDQIRKQKDSESKKEFNIEITELFKKYIEEHQQLTLPQLNGSNNNNSRSNANTVGLSEQNNLNNELKAINKKQPINQSGN